MEAGGASGKWANCEGPVKKSTYRAVPIAMIKIPRPPTEAMSERRDDAGEGLLLAVLVFLIVVVIWRTVAHFTGR